MKQTQSSVAADPVADRIEHRHVHVWQDLRLQTKIIAMIVASMFVSVAAGAIAAMHPQGVFVVFIVVRQTLCLGALRTIRIGDSNNNKQ